MRIEIEAPTSAGQAVIQLHGKLDANTTMIVEQTLLSEIASGQKHLVLDCANMDFISSAGLRSLLLAVKKMKAAGGMIGLAALQPNVKEVFDISGFSALFTIHSTTAEALA